jgi:hypothetical protein
MIEAMAAARAAADQLQLRSFLLGYNVMYTVSTQSGTGLPPEITYHVRRIDRLSDFTSNFASIAEVEARLIQLAMLPRYRLDLVGDPEIEEYQDDKHAFTTIREAATGEEFYVRVMDIEAATFLEIHAEEAPTPNWHRV